MQKTVLSYSMVFVFIFSFLFLGCSSAQKATPHLDFGGMYLETNIDRDDIVVLDRVEGKSTVTSILGGLFSVVDGNKYQVFWIKFFKDKYTSLSPIDNTTFFGMLVNALRPVYPAERAYYQALEAHPEADAVFSKSTDNESDGFWPFYTSKTVRFHGKAIKLKEDK